MKIALIFKIMMFLSLTSTSQIEMKKPIKTIKIGEVRQAGTFNCSLEYQIIEKDTVCVLYYNNAEYTTLTDIQSISFDPDENTIQKLYDALKSFFLKENEKNKDYELSFTLGKTDVTLSHKRTLGITYIMFFTVDGYFYLTQRQVEKLFGK